MISKEEKHIWEVCFFQSKNKSLSFENFETIFLCNSYFSEIAGLDPEDSTTTSTLIAVDYNNIFYFIDAIEYTDIYSGNSQSFELKINKFSNYKQILSILPEHWKEIKLNILHYGLEKELIDHLSANIKKQKI